MNFRNMALKLALAGVFFSFVTGVSAAKADAEKDIVDTAVAAGSFKTLVKAVQAAGLVDTLKGADLSPFSPQQTRLSQRWKKPSPEPSPPF